MAPLSSEEFVATGFKGITKFRGVLVDAETGVSGKYGDQVRLEWEDAEVLAVEGDEDFPVFEDGVFQTWVKESPSTSSVNWHMIDEVETFCRENKIAPISIHALKGLNLVWERHSQDYGDELSPGTWFAPIEFVKPPHPAKEKVVEGKTTELSDATVAVIKEAVGDGVPASKVRRGFSKFPAAVRKEIGGVENVPEVLATLVAQDVLYEDDGVFYAETTTETPW